MVRACVRDRPLDNGYGNPSFFAIESPVVYGLDIVSVSSDNFLRSAYIEMVPGAVEPRRRTRQSHGRRSCARNITPRPPRQSMYSCLLVTGNPPSYPSNTRLVELEGSATLCLPLSLSFTSPSVWSLDVTFLPPTMSITYPLWSAAMPCAYDYLFGYVSICRSLNIV